MQLVPAGAAGGGGDFGAWISLLWLQVLRVGKFIGLYEAPVIMTTHWLTIGLSL